MFSLKKIPGTFTIVFFLILFAAFTTWWLPGGEYNPVQTEDGNTLQYHTVDSQPQTWQIFSAIYKGFTRQAGIIVFILIVGGAFWVINHHRAVDVGIYSFLRYTSSLQQYRFMRWLGVDNMILVLIMLMFSIFGAVFGMSEETIAFAVVLIPLAISMGYDSITGVCMVYVAAHLGFAGAILNPFTIGIAQGLAGLPLFSGIEYRLVCWMLINMVGFAFVLRYARKVKANPRYSPVYESDAYWREREKQVNEIPETLRLSRGWWVYAAVLSAIGAFAWFYPLTTLKLGNTSFGPLPLIPLAGVLFAVTGIMAQRASTRHLVLTLLFFTIGFLIIGVMGYQWYIMEITALFFALGIVSGVAMNNKPDEIVKLFMDGARDIFSAAMVVGLAGGIIVILEDGKVVATLLHVVSGLMNNLGEYATLSSMYVIQTLINIIIPSGSAKAALTIPIMAPFSDLIGLSRQAMIMAFQFGDGFTNMITPTSGVLIGVLGVARIPYSVWVKWIAPLMLLLILLGFLLLIPTITLPLNGF